MSYSVGQVSDLAGVTIRTLHHYDEIGLLSPSGRSAAGYRIYEEAEIYCLLAEAIRRRRRSPSGKGLTSDE